MPIFEYNSAMEISAISAYQHSEKKWSQTGASEEPFWKMAPLCKEGPFFSKKKVKNGALKALKWLHF